jgi:hypothetical protein
MKPRLRLQHVAANPEIRMSRASKPLPGPSIADQLRAWMKAPGMALPPPFLRGEGVAHRYVDPKAFAANPWPPKRKPRAKPAGWLD